MSTRSGYELTEVSIKSHWYCGVSNLLFWFKWNECKCSQTTGPFSKVSQFKVNRSLLFLDSKQVLTWVIKSPSSSTTTLIGILSEACSHETFSQWNCKRFSCTNSQNCTAGSSFEAIIQYLCNSNLKINFKSIFKSKIQSQKINCRKYFQVKLKTKQFNQEKIQSPK